MPEIQRNFGKTIGKLGEPAWQLLHSLDESDPRTATQIARIIEDLYCRAQYPAPFLDLKAVRLGLHRLCEVELARNLRGPNDPIYIRTSSGTQAITAFRRLQAVLGKI